MLNDPDNVLYADDPDDSDSVFLRFGDDGLIPTFQDKLRFIYEPENGNPISVDYGIDFVSLFSEFPTNGAGDYPYFPGGNRGITTTVSYTKAVNRPNRA